MRCRAACHPRRRQSCLTSASSKLDDSEARRRPSWRPLGELGRRGEAVRAPTLSPARGWLPCRARKTLTAIRACEGCGLAMVNIEAPRACRGETSSLTAPLGRTMSPLAFNHRRHILPVPTRSASADEGFLREGTGGQLSARRHHQRAVADPVELFGDAPGVRSATTSALRASNHSESVEGRGVGEGPRAWARRQSAAPPMHITENPSC
jgi:hypothetical protein